jgi:hypothetical protein
MIYVCGTVMEMAYVFQKEIYWQAAYSTRRALETSSQKWISTFILKYTDFSM